MAEVNTYAQFPHIDQFTKDERSAFIKEHEFQKFLEQMLSELNALLDTSSSSSNEINSKKAQVQTALNQLTSEVESELRALVARYIESISDEMNQVEAAYERLYARLHTVIQSININVKNRTITYDIVQSYKTRILDKAYEIFGPTPAYNSKPNNDFIIDQADTRVVFRDCDDGAIWRSYPIVIDPSITQDKFIKIFEFTPVKNDTPVPSFLAEIMIQGDLYSFNGYLKSTQIAEGDRTKRSAVFDAKYFVNQDIPFAFKVLYDKERNKVALAFKYDETSDSFTSIVKLDVSVLLLVGSDLIFTDTSKATIMDNVDANYYSVTVNTDEYLKVIGNVQTKVSHNGNITLQFASIDEKHRLPDIEDNKSNINIMINDVLASEELWTFDSISGVLVIDNVTGDTVITVNSVPNS